MTRYSVVGVMLLVFIAASTTTVRGGDAYEDRWESIQCEADSLTAELIPIVAEMNGFSECNPIVNEVTTKAKLKELLGPMAREYYGEDGFERAGRVGSALGLLPPDYDLEAGWSGLLIELMGGGYDPLNKKIYVLADIPFNLSEDPDAKRMIAAHEITHALQDQNEDLAAHLRRGVSDWDHDHLFNSIIEGMAYVTMMAVYTDTSLPDAPDPTDMLGSTRSQMARSPAFPEYAKAPLYLTESMFGAGLNGIAFCRSLIKENPEIKLATLLASLPASSEQILHFEKYRADDRPTPIDLSGLSSHLPDDWEPYFANNLGEFHVRVLCESHDATEDSGDTIAEGWDGCEFQAFMDAEDHLTILGLSVWDSEADAQEFADGFGLVLAAVHDPEMYTIECENSYVRFVIGLAEGETRQRSMKALRSIQATSVR